MKKSIKDTMDAWVAARKRHRLSHALVQMARELGMNPAKLGKIDNHRQEPWKAPLADFIESLYLKRFGRERPEVVRTIEEWGQQADMKAAGKKLAKIERKRARDANSNAEPTEVVP